MQEDLLIDILNALQAGEIYPGDIQRSWENNGKFVDNAEFHTAWHLLKSRKAIISMPNQNDVAKTIINPINNVLPELLRKQRERLMEKEQNMATKNLAFQNMQTENLKLVDELIDLPKIRRQRNILFVIAIIELIATIILVFKGK